MKFLSTLFERISNWTLIVLMLLLTVSTAAQVVSRFVIRSPLLWTEEVSRMAFIWIALLGSSIATKHQQHLGIDIIVTKFPPMLRRGVRLAMHGVMMSVALLFIFAGSDFVQKNIGRISETTGVSMVWLYIAAPISGAMMLFYLIEQLPDLLKKEA
jgi:TRAP-type C4-dicarboxylate transport system permease small subunit